MRLARWGCGSAMTSSHKSAIGWPLSSEATSWVYWSLRQLFLFFSTGDCSSWGETHLQCSRGRADDPVQCTPGLTECSGFRGVPSIATNPVHAAGPHGPSHCIWTVARWAEGVCHWNLAHKCNEGEWDMGASWCSCAVCSMMMSWCSDGWDEVIPLCWGVVVIAVCWGDCSVLRWLHCVEVIALCWGDCSVLRWLPYSWSAWATNGLYAPDCRYVHMQKLTRFGTKLAHFETKIGTKCTHCCM